MGVTSSLRRRRTWPSAWTRRAWGPGSTHSSGCASRGPTPPVDGVITARVIHVDTFGNAVTNLKRADAPNVASVEAAGRLVGEVRPSYGWADEGTPLAVWGSGGRLEIAIRNGSAAESLGLARGDRVLVRLDG